MRSMRLVIVGVALLLAVTAIPLVARAQGMMGPGGGWGHPGQAPVSGPVAIDQAIGLVRQYVARLGGSDLAPVEIMEFSDGFYVIVAEKSTKIGAFELLVNRNGFIRPEPGPNMMWNTKYGHMAGWGGYGMMGGYGMRGGGMMGDWGNPGYGPSATGPTGQQLAREQVRQIVQAWLTQAFPGAKAGEGMPFYGYFTFDFERNGKIVGMASVNAYTGQVWYHNWHGTFVREKELD